MNTQELVAEVLKLEPAARFELIECALHSLDKPDAEMNRLWIEEAERRLLAYRSGRVQGFAAEEEKT
ncbi:MAG: addiction module protein [Halothiobacillaceae bacterium]